MSIETTQSAGEIKSPIWLTIKSDKKDANGSIPLIGFTTDSINEVGVPIAVVSLTKVKEKYYKEKIKFLDYRAINDPLVQKTIHETIENFLLIN